MTERITAGQFHAADGVADWRLPGLDDHQPDVDLRSDGVLVHVVGAAV